MAINKFELNDIVIIKEGFGLVSDRQMNPWKVTGISLVKDDRVSYRLVSLSNKASTGFFEEALELSSKNTPPKSNENKNKNKLDTF